MSAWGGAIFLRRLRDQRHGEQPAPRIAALVLLQPRLDENYRSVAEPPPRGAMHRSDAPRGDALERAPAAG